jgi:hypothetical protein
MQRHAMVTRIGPVATGSELNHAGMSTAILLSNQIKKETA